MSDDIVKIKLQIANRYYPMTIKADQEETLRKASQKIQQQLQQFEDSYGIKNKQDLLAMCAIQFAAQVEQQEQSTLETNSQLREQFDALGNLVEDVLSEV